MNLLRLLWSFVRYPSVWTEMLYWFVEKDDENLELTIPYEDDLSPNKRTMWDEPKKKK